MTRLIQVFQGFDCQLFQKVNRHFEKKLLNLFFRIVTNFGGADVTISISVLLLLLPLRPLHLVAISSALALSASHLLVQAAKQLFPRKRPYLMIKDTMFPANPLEDHSFPSGHTTAIFFFVTPYVLFMPSLGVYLIPIAFCVGLSRIYLGLHYPSDVMAGGMLGMISGILSFILLVY